MGNIQCKMRAMRMFFLGNPACLVEGVQPWWRNVATVPHLPLRKCCRYDDIYSRFAVFNPTSVCNRTALLHRKKYEVSLGCAIQEA